MIMPYGDAFARQYACATLAQDDITGARNRAIVELYAEIFCL